MSYPASEHSGLVQLKDLIPLGPWNRPPPPLSKNQQWQYVKVKDQIYKNGKRVYWQPKIIEKADDPEYEVPYGRLFELGDKCAIKTLKRWIDKLFGQIFGLPKPEYD